MGDGDTTTTAPADATLATNCEKWDVCPADTALAGVTINPDSPDTLPADVIPDICTVQGLEKCPDGTPQEGDFVMGDGNLATNQVTDDTLATYDAMLFEICNANDDQTEECPDDSQLDGIIVKDTGMGPEPACNPFEICPADTVLGGVIIDPNSPDNNGDMIPDVCDQTNLAAAIEDCITYLIALGDGAARSAFIDGIVQGSANLVNTGIFPDDVGDYPALDNVDGVIDGDIIGYVPYNPNAIQLCLQFFQLAEIMFEVLDSGLYSLSDYETAIAAVTSGGADDLVTRLFNCIEGQLMMSMMSISSADLAEQHATTSSQSTVNTENTK